MKSILEELFYGNICPNTDCRGNDEQTKELMVYIADHHNALKSELIFISVYVPGNVLPGSRASVFPVPHELGTCPDKEA